MTGQTQPARPATRRLAAAVLAAIALLPLGAAASPAAQPAAPPPAAQGGGKDRPPMVIAHRGGAMNRPENTLAALRHAARLGVEILEFDMLMTADDQIVVHHDAAINPAFCRSGGSGGVAPAPVRSLTFEQARTFDCGSGVRPAYAGEGFVAVQGERIPSLDEALALAAASGAMVFPETKVPPAAPGVKAIDPVRFATLLEAAVRRHGLEDRVIVQSFDFRTIDALHAINPRIRTCLLGVPRLTRDYLALLRKHHARCIVLSDTEVDSAGVRALQDAGVLVFSGVIDRPEDWRKSIDLGMDALFTNDPERLIGFLRTARPVR